MTSTASFPTWLSVLSWASVLCALACAVVAGVDVSRHRQPMPVMNVVWPVTMLFGSLAWLAFYWRKGRPVGDHHRDRTMSEAVAVGTSHCGAGCTIGDLVGEFTLVAVPGLAAVFGYGWLFADPMFAAWTLDFVLAFIVGIAFQYFAIAPMRDVTVREGLWQAVQADTLSITAWQVGMYGVMAVVQLWLFPLAFGGRAAATTPEFWWSMQLAMVAGFVTAYPVNWLLIRRGVKERM